jgi:hypothetical protein
MHLKLMLSRNGAAAAEKVDINIRKKLKNILCHFEFIRTNQSK